MKVVNAFINIFAIFIFLTLGSFLIIVSFHLVSQQEALRAVTEIYAEPLRTLQAGLLGVLFIVVGLAFAKYFLKNLRGNDALVIQGERGVITITIHAIEDLTEKVLKKFEGIQTSKIKVVIKDGHLDLKIGLTVWSEVLVPKLVQDVQTELTGRLGRILGVNGEMDINVTIDKVILSKQPKIAVA